MSQAESINLEYGRSDNVRKTRDIAAQVFSASDRKENVNFSLDA
jgi:hypothetical protein